jgi:hypothetical protein
VSGKDYTVEVYVTTKLTKSRFTQALVCPCKLFYGLDSRYVNTRAGDEFLQGLADGGFQVGELARLFARAHAPDAIEINAADLDEQVRLTAEALKHDFATVFEATIRYENLLVRVDVLDKRGDRLYVQEVKSKSFNVARDTFRTQDGRMRAGWLPYLYDVAFQVYVVSKAFPDLEVNAGLILVDPDEVVEVDGLGSALRVRRTGRTAEVIVSPELDLGAVNERILKCYDVNQEVQQLLGGVVEAPGMSLEFDELWDRLVHTWRRERGRRPGLGGTVAPASFTLIRVRPVTPLGVGGRNAWRRPSTGSWTVPGKTPSFASAIWIRPHIWRAGSCI